MPPSPLSTEYISIGRGTEPFTLVLSVKEYSKKVWTDGTWNSWQAVRVVFRHGEPIPALFLFGMSAWDLLLFCLPFPGRWVFVPAWASWQFRWCDALSGPFSPYSCFLQEQVRSQWFDLWHAERLFSGDTQWGAQSVDWKLHWLAWRIFVRLILFLSVRKLNYFLILLKLVKYTGTVVSPVQRVSQVVGFSPDWLPPIFLLLTGYRISSPVSL